MRGFEMRQESELRLATFAAWQIARLSHFNGGKLKSLAECLREIDAPGATPPRRQSREEMIAAMRLIKETMTG
jgi:hypothetical protein